MAAHPRVRVWPLTVRLLHWALAALVIADLVIDDGGPLHRWVGYVAAALVLVRLAWATVQGELAELRPSLSRTSSYVGQLLRGQPPRSPGHDPLGLWMAWLLWALVLLLGLTGWMTRLDAFWGDQTLHAVHALLADILLAAVALHLLGVAVMSLMWRENLPAAMVTGFKRAD